MTEVTSAAGLVHQRDDGALRRGQRDYQVTHDVIVKRRLDEVDPIVNDNVTSRRAQGADVIGETVDAEDGQSIPWLEATLKFLAVESSSEVPGAQIIMARLTEVLFIQILRAHIAYEAKGSQNCKSKASLLRGLIDPQIGKALSLIHQQPHHAWTVANLAEQVGMSRTSFAMHFATVTGFAPFDYLRKWRMQKAGDMLRQGEDNLDEIAGRVGYESGAAFSKAFKREMGMPPGLYRRERLAPVEGRPASG
jgi:AraC-like DNA-binding protein